MLNFEMKIMKQFYHKLKLVSLDSKHYRKLIQLCLHCLICFHVLDKCGNKKCTQKANLYGSHTKVHCQLIYQSQTFNNFCLVTIISRGEIESLMNTEAFRSLFA